MWVWSILKSKLLCNIFITINYNSPLFGFLSSPYFTRDASCVVLNIDWTPLLLKQKVIKLHNLQAFLCVSDLVSGDWNPV